MEVGVEGEGDMIREAVVGLARVGRFGDLGS